MPPGGDVSELTWSADAYGAHTLGAFAELQACIKDEHTTLLLVRVLSAVSLPSPDSKMIIEPTAKSTHMNCSISRVRGPLAHRHTACIVGARPDSAKQHLHHAWSCCTRPASSVAKKNRLTVSADEAISDRMAHLHLLWRCGPPAQNRRRRLHRILRGHYRADEPPLDGVAGRAVLPPSAPPGRPPDAAENLRPKCAV